MKTIRIKSSKSYDVNIGAGLLGAAGEYAAGISKPCTVFIVSDDNVYPLYGDALADSLEKAGFRTEKFVFPHGEKSKCLAVYGELLEAMCAAHITRSDMIAALGGGVVGDLAGFAAATYQRGIKFMQVPTTLLAAVDSSVGGKTAIDLKGGKNQAGCFYQPHLVLIDTDTLATLPPEQYRCGAAEIIKYAVLGSEKLFRDIKSRPISAQYEDIIAACVSIKRDFVEEDEFDTGVRMKLNLGHTFGHAAEAISGFTVLHGQAVAMGMAVMARAAAARGIADADTLKEILDICADYGLPTDMPYSAEDVLACTLSDKKSTGASIRLIVPERIGCCRIETVSTADIPAWLHDGGLK